MWFHHPGQVLREGFSSWLTRLPFCFVGLLIPNDTIFWQWDSTLITCGLSCEDDQLLLLSFFSSSHRLPTLSSSSVYNLYIRTFYLFFYFFSLTSILHYITLEVLFKLVLCLLLHHSCLTVFSVWNCPGLSIRSSALFRLGWWCGACLCLFFVVVNNQLCGFADAEQ